MNSTPAPFAARLRESRAAHGPLVVGIDPHVALLEAWGLDDDADGLKRFSRTVLDAVADDACAVKPQSAFFERHGAAGIAVLEEILTTCRDRGILTILDVKRGDIGSTMTAYAGAYLRPGAPLEADAITVSPYLGVGSLSPALAHVDADGKGLFVLALTSNPDGASIQHVGAGSGHGAGRAVAAVIADDVAARNARERERTGERYGSIGLVVGATVGDAPARLGIELEKVAGPLLAPGIGAQGAGPEELRSVFGAARPQVLASVSRGVLKAGPDPAKLAEVARKARRMSSDALLSE